MQMDLCDYLALDGNTRILMRKKRVRACYDIQPDHIERVPDSSKFLEFVKKELGTNEESM